MLSKSTKYLRKKLEIQKKAALKKSDTKNSRLKTKRAQAAKKLIQAKKNAALAKDQSKLNLAKMKQQQATMKTQALQVQKQQVDA